MQTEKQTKYTQQIYHFSIVWNNINYRTYDTTARAYKKCITIHQNSLCVWISTEYAHKNVQEKLLQLKFICVIFISQLK